MPDAPTDVMIETSDGPMRGYTARPDHPARTAVIVVQEAFGVNPHIEDVTRRVAAAGHLAIAPDFFHRTGPGAVVEYGQFEKVLEHFAPLSDETILADVDATLTHLHGDGFDDRRIGIVGFCFGGRVTFLTALTHPLGAAVGFYGGGIVSARFPQFPALIERVDALKTPWLGLFGDQDASIPIDDVERLRVELRGAPVAADIVRYADAGHGFHCDQRPDYRPDDARDAWNRTLAWFDAHLG